MADTLITLVQRIARNCGLDATFTSFSDDDETQYLVDHVNFHYQNLRARLPAQVTYFDKDGTLSLSNGTRLYSIASDAYLSEIYAWSLEDETNNDVSIPLVTMEYLEGLDPRYDEVTGKPTHAYIEQGKIGFYPIPDSSITINYKYRQVPSRLSSTSATFLIPDNWLSYIELGTELDYKNNKNFSGVELVLKQFQDKDIEITVAMHKLNPTFFRPSRRYP